MGMGPRVAGMPRDFLVAVVMGTVVFLCFFLLMVHQVWLQVITRH